MSPGKKVLLSAGKCDSSWVCKPENQSRASPAGWVSGRTRLRRRIPYWQLCDINTCLLSLSSQPFINAAVAVRFSLFFFLRINFHPFLSKAEILPPLALLFIIFLCSYKANVRLLVFANMKQKRWQIQNTLCFLGCHRPVTWVQLLLLHFILCGMLQPHMNI